MMRFTAVPCQNSRAGEGKSGARTAATKRAATMRIRRATPNDLAWHFHLARDPCAYHSPLTTSAALEAGDGHLAIQLHAELVGDRQGLFTIAVGGHLHIPAEEVVRPALAQVDAVLAQLRRALEER